MKKIVFIGLIILMVFVCINYIVIPGITKDAYKRFVADDGKEYMYYKGTETECIINGINLLTASKEEIIACFNNSSDVFEALGEIADHEEAAKAAVSVLNQSYDNWTFENKMVVWENASEQIWIIHGQLEKRGNTGEIGVVVFDGETGELLGVDLVGPESD